MFGFIDVFKAKLFQGVLKVDYLKIILGLIKKMITFSSSKAKPMAQATHHPPSPSGTRVEKRPSETRYPHRPPTSSRSAAALLPARPVHFSPFLISDGTNF